ncbi:Nn.00g019580.m01.CDS01 [Neocucurbitaria sp. VM-36]
MLANIVDDLFVQCKAEISNVAYFFCRHDLPESLKARTVIGALVRQMIRPFFSAIEKESSIPLDTLALNSLTSDTIVYLLRYFLPRKYKTYVVLDGLDLCDRAEQEMIAKQLQDLQREFSIFSCVSLRLDPEARQESISEGFPGAKVVSSLENTSDIEAFIEAELELCLERRKLVIGDPLLILDIHEALSKGSKGMFLWVALQIKSLCTMQTDEEITNALSDLPEDLSEIYNLILKKSPESDKSYQKQILEVVTAAQRHLTVEELREAVSVSPGDTVWTASKLVNDIYSAMATCGCLLVVDEEEETVRFMHPSVEQFLFSRYRDSKGSKITIEGCHRTMADIIVTYLSYGVFGTELSTTRVPKFQVGSAPAMIVQSTTTTSKSAQNLALKLLKLRKRSDFDAGLILAKELRNNQSPRVQEFHFHRYALQECLVHVSELRDHGQVVAGLLPAYLVRNSVTSRCVNVPDKLFISAIHRNDIALMKLLLSATNNMVPLVDNKLWVPESPLGYYAYYSPLDYAVCKGSEEFVDLIMERVKIADHITWGIIHSGQSSLYIWDLWCRSAFFGAQSSDFEDYIPLIKSNDDCSHICISGRGPLSCAVWGGQNSTLELFLKSEMFDVNAGLFERSAIWEAVRLGNAYAVRVLLDTGQVELGEGKGEKLWSLAMENGDKEIIAMLAYHTHRMSDEYIPLDELPDNYGDRR